MEIKNVERDMDCTNITVLLSEGKYEEAATLMAEIPESDYDDVAAILDYEIKKNTGCEDSALLECIRKGMAYNLSNYELYVCLAEIYKKTGNTDQSYLCLEQALHFCGNEDDYPVIADMLNGLIHENEINVVPYSIVIPSYNCKDMLIECIESIRKTCLKGTYEIIAVDNASSDGITEWLSTQDDITLIANKVNAGFGRASNQGVKAAAPDNDIFFLNNDTIVTENAIFWLRMAVYSDDKTAAAGSVSNSIGRRQRVEKGYSTKEEWIDFAKTNNILDTKPHEIRTTLVGFAMFVKRTVLDKVGLFDEIYGIGNFEDDDLCMRILREGYKSVLCSNSFIFHYGSQSFNKDINASNMIFEKNWNIFHDKWGFDILYYSTPRYELINLINDPPEAAIKVLEVGCGMGATLARIKYLWPGSDVRGVEIISEMQKFASKNFDIILGDIETAALPYDKKYFDYIVCGGIFGHLKDPEATLKKLKDYLAPSGAILACIPNIMHHSALLPLLRGKFDYEDYGVLDKKNTKFFTLNSIAKMFHEAGMKIDTIMVTYSDDSPMEKEKELVDGLTKLLGNDFKNSLSEYQYLIKAVRK